jgi:hypothetical protein
MKQFYMAAEEDESLKNEYNARLGGNGETGSIKIGNIISMINNWADEHYYA